MDLSSAGAGFADIVYRKFIEPFAQFVGTIFGIIFGIILLFAIYTIIKLRLNPFHMTKAGIRRLKRMQIKFKPLDFIRWLVVDAIYFRKYRYDFNQYGLTVYCGRQGAGKTISMIDYANRIHKRYPECIIVANFAYKYADCMMEDWHDFLNIRNGKKGVLFLIDEIHSEYSNDSWKDFPESLLSEISQQRKQRVKICATSQIYTRVVKQLREQCFSVVQCSTLGDRWTFNKEYDAKDYEIHCETVSKKGLKPFRKHSFVQDNELRRCYDTYEKIERLAKMEFIDRHER